MSLSRNNHYIPQLYLKRWARENRISTYQLLVSHENVWIWNRKPIRHAGSLQNLYINIRNEEELDDIEHKIDVCFESPAKMPFDKLCEGTKLEKDDWIKIADYIAIQYVRTPAFYLWAKDIGVEKLPEELDNIGRKLEQLREIPTTRRENVNGIEYLPVDVKITDIKPDEKHTYVEISAVAGKGLWLFQIIQTMDKDSPIRQYFRRLRWNVINAPIGECWPTSDNPIVICDICGNNIKRAASSGGLLGKEKAILFPVSPDKILLATTVRSYKWLNKEADKELAAMIREAIVNNAMMYIYSKDEDSKIPLIRPRIINEQEFNRLTNDFENWFDVYKEIEGPLLNR